MVVAAIKSLNEISGSTPSSIKNYISQYYKIDLSTDIDNKSGNKQNVEKLIDNILKNGVKKQVLEEESGLYKIGRINKEANSNKVKDASESFVCYECGYNESSKIRLKDHIKDKHASQEALHLIDHYGYNSQTEKHFMMSSGNKIYKDHIPFYSLSVGVAIKQELIEKDMRRENL